MGVRLYIFAGFESYFFLPVLAYCVCTCVYNSEWQVIVEQVRYENIFKKPKKIRSQIGSVLSNTSNLWKHLEIYHKAIWEEIMGKKQPSKKRRREDNNDSGYLLDNDSERMERDTNAGPSFDRPPFDE